MASGTRILDAKPQVMQRVVPPKVLGGNTGPSVGCGANYSRAQTRNRPEFLVHLRFAGRFASTSEAASLTAKLSRTGRPAFAFSGDARLVHLHSRQ